MYLIPFILFILPPILFHSGNHHTVVCIYELFVRLLLFIFFFKKPPQPQSGDSTILFDECFSATNCFIYRFKQSFNKPMEYFLSISSIQKSNQLAIQKVMLDEWFSNNKNPSLMVCLNVQST